jgi:hypothetical protein
MRMLGVKTIVLHSYDQCFINAQRFKVLLDVLYQNFVHAIHIGTLIAGELPLELTGFTMSVIVLSEAQTCYRRLSVGRDIVGIYDLFHSRLLDIYTKLAVVTHILLLLTLLFGFTSLFFLLLSLR